MKQNNPLRAYCMNLINDLNIYSRDYYDIKYRGASKHPAPCLFINDSLQARGWNAIKNLLEMHYMLKIDDLFEEAL